MDTPRWNIQLLDEKNVYEPAEDTFLLLDALQEDMKNILCSNVSVVLEIGSGSGIVITAVSSLLSNMAHCIAVDINPDACLVTKDTAQLNGVSVDVINADLLKSFSLRSSIDMIIFNPPYVETENDEVSQTGITQSWAGGINGRKIIDELLPVLNSALSTSGTLYLVAISYNDIDDLESCMKSFGFHCSVLLRRQIRGELLVHDFDWNSPEWSTFV